MVYLLKMVIFYSYVSLPEGNYGMLWLHTFYPVIGGTAPPQDPSFDPMVTGEEWQAATVEIVFFFAKKVCYMTATSAALVGLVENSSFGTTRSVLF